MSNSIVEPLLNNFQKNNSYSLLEDHHDIDEYYISIDDDTIYYSSSRKLKNKKYHNKHIIHKFNVRDRGKKVKKIII